MQLRRLPRMLQILLAPALLLVAPPGIQAASIGGADNGGPISASELVGQRRILAIQGVGSRPFLSPDGQRYLLVIGQGDLEKNGYWVEFWSGSLREGADVRPQMVLKLFTTAVVGPNGIYPVIHPGTFHIQWLSDNKRIVFGWSNGQEPTSLRIVDLESGRSAVLASASTSITEFQITPDGETGVYSSYPISDCARSGAISATSLLQLLATGCVNGDNYWHHLDQWLLSPGGKSSPLDLQAGLHTSLLTHLFSPDGRYAFLPIQDSSISDPAWPTYTDSAFRNALTKNDGDPYGGWLMVSAIIDIARGTKRAIVNLANPIDNPTRAVWSPNSDFVIVGPTYLPPSFGTAGALGNALVQYDPHTGGITVLPTPDSATKPEIVSWQSQGRLLVRSNGSLFQYVREDRGGWVYRAVSAPPGRVSLSYYEADVEEGANRPPSLVIKNRRTGRTKFSMKIDAALGDQPFFRVEELEWRAGDGALWHGRLYYPRSYDRSRLYPLVVQTHGLPKPEEFALNGIGDAFGTVYAAQPLTQRGIFVLQVEDHADIDQFMQAEAHSLGYASGVEQLVARGLIDRNRVGIAGFSRTGWYIEHALAFDDFPYAAAIVADNINYSYLEAAAGVPNSNELAPEMGGNISGSSMAHWLARSPSFSAERIRTPLKLELDRDGPVAALGSWDLFSRMRNADLPVEMTLLANAAQGAHPLQNPRMRLESTQGAIDWFRFWLQDYEDPDPAKSDQYRRWRLLRSVRNAALKVPRPPKLVWTAAPVPSGTTALGNIPR